MKRGTSKVWLAALTVAVMVGVGQPSFAQGQGVNPTASAVSEEQLLRQLDTLSGRITIPDGKAAVLQQPQGRDYRGFREGVLPWLGGILVLGMIGALAVFYAVRGRIGLEPGAETGRKILRFNAMERFTHWFTALSFIVLALSGLNYIFGKRLLMPLIGPDAFASFSQYAKYAHNYLAWPFMLGVVVILLIWIRDNIPDRVDVYWLKEGGGIIGGGHPPARRFNAGQKLIFWSVVLGGIALSASGLLMLFPFSGVGIYGMQVAQYVHATVGVIMVAIMLAHIYIGTLGMEGAYDAMGSGEVDLGWARTHHSLWVEEQQAKTASGPQIGRPAPAE